MLVNLGILLLGWEQLIHELFSVQLHVTLPDTGLIAISFDHWPCITIPGG